MSRMKAVTCLEFAGRQYPVSDIEAYVKECVKSRYPDRSVKTIGIYMQPETDHVYYTMDGEGTPEDSFGFDEIPLE